MLLKLQGGIGHVAEGVEHREVTAGIDVKRFSQRFVAVFVDGIEDLQRGLSVSNHMFQMRLLGPFGSGVVVEASANVQIRTPVQTNTLTPDSLELSLPMNEDQAQFYRARLVP